jgi:single-stranded DNA-specific DHH superfamily exonuclease
MGKGSGSEACIRPPVALAGVSALRDSIRAAESTVPGMQDAAALLLDAVRAGGAVAVFSDYDLDGTASAALIGRALRACGADEHQIAFGHATPAQGFGDMTSFLAANRDADVLVCCDCGSSQTEAVAAAQNAGTQVIVVDHHPAADGNPADFHLNPSAHGMDNHLSGAQLTWKLGGEVLSQQDGFVPGWWYQQPLVLAAQGALADRVDDKHPENHAFVQVPLDEHDGVLPASAGLELLAARFGEKLSNPRRLVRTRSALNLPKRTDRVPAQLPAQLLSASSKQQAAPLVKQLIDQYHGAVARRDQMQQACTEDLERRDGAGVAPVAAAVVDGFADDSGQAGVLAMRVAAAAGRPAVVFCELGQADAAGRPLMKFSVRPHTPRKKDTGPYQKLDGEAAHADAQLRKLCTITRTGERPDLKFGGHPHAGVLSGTCARGDVDAVVQRLAQFAEQVTA